MGPTDAWCVFIFDCFGFDGLKQRIDVFDDDRVSLLI